MKNAKKELLRYLGAAEYCAKSGRLGRFLAAPWRYMSTMYFLHLQYPRAQKGKLAQTVPFFKIPMQLVLPAGTDIYLTGCKSHDSEIRLARYMILALKSGMQFVDIGAHIGYFSLLAARIVGEKGRVLAVEASKSTFTLLTQNVGSQANIKAVNACISETDGEQTFYEFPILYNEYNTLEPAQFEQEEWIKANPPQAVQVQSQTLQTLLRQNELTPHLIKIDVEGAEDKVIAGAIAYLETIFLPNRPRIVLEYLSSNRQNVPHQKAKAELERLGYSPFAIDKKGELKPCPDIEGYLSQIGLDSDNIVFVCGLPAQQKKAK
jgi:FkbM family methyltransferase